MVESYDISLFNEFQVKKLCDELKSLDPNVLNKIEYVKRNTGVSIGEALEYVVNRDPKLWAKVYINWEARDYQEIILEQGSKVKQLVLRFGRRLGKTESMCILILWYAYTQVNKGPNENQYDILIVTPSENQIDLIFDRLHQLIEMSPMLRQELKRDVYHRLEWINGSKIQGFTAGTKNNGGAASLRGLRADVLIFDECDYLNSNDITNTLNIRNEAPERIRVIAASTPCGKHEEYYQWCTGASKHFFPKEEDILNYTFTDYLISESKKGNGWTEIYAPSTVNKEILKINPDTGVTYLEDLKNQFSELKFQQEVMAEFGDEAMGVYRKMYIAAAVKEGLRLEHKYTSDFTDSELKEYLRRPRFNPRILGVDNDKTQAGCTFVCIELDKLHKDEYGNVEPKFKVLFREEIPQTQFTYSNEINRIIELNDIYDFDYIAIDRGYGEQFFNRRSA